MDPEIPLAKELSEAEAALADEQFEAALALHQAGRIAEAEALYQQVLQVDTEHPGALYLLGGMAYEANDYERAFALVARALREQPDDPDALHLLGLSALRLGRAADAVDAIEQALALRPDYAHAQSSLESAFNSLAAESMRADRPDEAAQHLLRCLDLNPENFEALLQLGLVHTCRREFTAAVDCYRRALALQPTHPELLANLAAAHHQLGETGAAIENYRRVLAQQPDHANTYCNLGVALQQQEDFDEALACFQQAAALAPELALAHNLFGAALMGQSRWQEAEASLRRALALQPDFVLASNNLGIALMRLGRHQEAAQVFETSLQHDPDNGDARHLLASLRGETTDSAPRDYIENLFDSHAGRFEEYLVGNLSYRIPTLMRAIVDRFGKRRFAHALDLGCGTGLVGVQFEDIVDTLRGVDLSSKMLQQAERKDIYDHLYAEDVVDFVERSLRELPPYDLVLSADVFIYVGKLEPIFAAVRQVTVPGALFIFSVEDLQQGTLQIMPSGRYAHSADYIRTLAAHNGFVLTHSEQCELRKENGKIIPGNIFVLTC